MKLEERLDLLKKEVQKEEFLNQKGLGNEVAFWIFGYPPEKEILIRNTVKKLVENLEGKSIYAVNIDLFDLCLEIIEKKTNLKKVIEFERKKGSVELFNSLNPILKPETVRNAVGSKVKDNTNILFLTGLGKIFPLVRAHTILNNMQIVVNIPLIMFYPGEYSGKDLNLFNKFHDNNYYRAFPLLSDNLSEGVGING